MLYELTSEEEFNNVLEHDGLVIVDFSASWCRPCRVLAPLLEDLSKEYPSAKFIKVDFNKFESLAKKYDITMVPTYYFFRDGVQHSVVKGADLEAIKRQLANEN